MINFKIDNKEYLGNSQMPKAKSFRFKPVVSMAEHGGESPIRLLRIVNVRLFYWLRAFHSFDLVTTSKQIYKKDLVDLIGNRPYKTDGFLNGDTYLHNKQGRSQVRQLAPIKAISFVLSLHMRKVFITTVYKGSAGGGLEVSLFIKNMEG